MLRFLTPLAQSSGSAGFTDVNSLHFSAITYGSVADPTGFSSAITVSVWINTTLVSADAAILSKLDVASQWSWNFSLSDSGANLRFVVSPTGNFAGSTVLQGTKVINDGNWHHLVATFSGATTTMSIYVDGVLDNSTNLGPVTMYTSSVPILLGGFMNSGTPDIDFAGLMDWLSIYSTALTGAQVTALYNSGSPPSNMTSLSSYSSCTMWLPIGEGSDTASELFDQTGNGNNAALTGVVSGDFMANIP